MSPKSRAALTLLLTVASAAAPTPDITSVSYFGTCSGSGGASVDAGFPISLVAAHAQLLANHSWEWGTAAEALLELYNPELTVFSRNPFPGGGIPAPRIDATPALLFARPHINTAADSPTFIAEGAIGDPASLGVSAVLIGQSELQFLAAAGRQAAHLLHTAPRFANGAISQRADVAELWADFVYMAPPFLAYHAKATGDAALLAETVRQLGLYRAVLRADTSTGLWKHIVGPQSADYGLWSTGNAWAAAGMARVLGVVQDWPSAPGQPALAATVTGYIKEILDGARAVDREDGLLRNYLNNERWFGEASGTALLGATAYRVAVLAPHIFGKEYIAWADENRRAVANHIDATGILKPTVNPFAWLDPKPFTSGSPEGQSFAVLLYAAYRDCVCAGVCDRDN